MNLANASRQYVSYKQAIGMNFVTEDRILRSFTRRVGPRTAVEDVSSDAVLRFLNGGGPITLFWHRKHDVLSGFWTFAIQHGLTDRSPVPARRPVKPAPYVPYIYTHAELKRLLNGMTTFQTEWHKLQPNTFRAIFLLLYGAGLRIGEVIRLTCSDVDLADATLLIRLTKFYKTRRIAISSQLCTVLREYDSDRHRAGHPRHDLAPFFTYKRGGSVTRATVEDAFWRLRQFVGLSTPNQGAHHQPRLHDLRHTFAVHRVIAWYRSGANVQLLLPSLSTHLGHRDLAATQRYLTMTPELLAEASLRFEQYAGEVLNG